MPSTVVAAGGFQSKGASHGHRNKNIVKYGTPLPILLPSSPLHPAYRPQPFFNNNNNNDDDGDSGGGKYVSPSASSSSLSSRNPLKTWASGSRCADPSLLSSSSFLPSFVCSHALGRRPIIPQVNGVFDRQTMSVWITKSSDREILFNRGFFGKGTLSRSEPTWHKTRVDLLKGGASLAAEQIRQKRREERKQFKIDRAAAMMDAAKKAEAVLTGQLEYDIAASGSRNGNGIESTENANIDPATASLVMNTNMEGLNLSVGEEESVPPSPSMSTVTLATSATGAIDSVIPTGTQLTPQTFLVRPTRPDVNRNRGKKAFKRRPPPPAQAQTQGQGQGQGQEQSEFIKSKFASDSAVVHPLSTQSSTSIGDKAPLNVEGAEEANDEEVEEEEEEEFELDEELVVDMEHLQLGLEEAWFLSEGLGVLRIFDPVTQTYAPASAVLPLLLTPYPTSDLTPTALYPDDPFLVSYAVYHHFRSLGWVVRDGVKFCVDWLLYRRGPVFSHSAFSIVMIPEYEDEADRKNSPHGDTDWYRERLSWKWMNTIIRVNSLVQKTVILVYVTIPALSSFSTRQRQFAGGLDVRRPGLGMRDLMSKYHLREVALTRFGPARRRD